ncbi:ABC transporter ATP-binding protein [Ornithinicoccus halotolerans]|uniref:ABC transporter ATP-binding protein n=1 Tax=Ornithinicoccus halotolerans TaxID=1748220 RepID=UPI001297E67B|nr:ABC transporter ATP-binding protein [Ornithinicoccus halotolerans]
MIEARGVSHAYGQQPVLDDVDLVAPPGQVTGLIGPNGSGKTTLLRTLHAQLRPRAGTVLLDGSELGRLRPREVARRLAVVVQEPPSELPLVAADLVLLGRTPHRSGPGLGGMRARDEQVAANALQRVDAGHLAQRPVAELSGGERQRVLIARALAQEPDYLLLDEPTNHLDVRYQHELMTLVASLGVTVVVVLHDLNLAAAYCHHLVLLDGGRRVAAGDPAEVLEPAVLEAVYQVPVRRLELDGRLHLVLGRPRTRVIR